MYKLSINETLGIQLPKQTNLLGESKMSAPTTSTLEINDYMELASTQHLPIWLMELLSTDPDPRIRLKLAENRYCYIEHLNVLQNDLNEDVRNAANHTLVKFCGNLYNNTPDEEEDYIITSTDKEYITSIITNGSLAERMLACYNPHLTLNRISLLAGDDNHLVRESILQHPKIPTALVEYLTNDSHEDTRSYAKYVLYRRSYNKNLSTLDARVDNTNDIPHQKKR